MFRPARSAAGSFVYRPPARPKKRSSWERIYNCFFGFRQLRPIIITWPSCQPATEGAGTIKGTREKAGIQSDTTTENSKGM